MSYTRFDDQNDGEQLTTFREELSKKVQARIGASFSIFSDIADIEWGPQVEERINAALPATTFLIPIITPSFFENAHCRQELLMFLQREAALGHNNLILPVYYIESPVLEDPNKHPTDELAQILAARQRIDWRDLRLKPFTDQQVQAKLANIAAQISSVLDRLPPEPPSTRTAPLLEVAVNAPSAEPELPNDVPQLEAPEDTIPPESPFYVKRHGDRTAVALITQAGANATIKGLPHVGKSSLLGRTVAVARAAGKRVVRIDFQQFDTSARTNANSFFRQFCVEIANELKLDNQIDEYWDAELGHVQSCTRYVQHQILQKHDGPLVLAMDDVDTIPNNPFRLDFFKMLRSWHNSRSNSPSWNQLGMMLTTSTDPYQLVTDLNQSPFNVSEVIELMDFTLEQVNDLNQRHGNPLSPTQARHLMDLLNGHPYLVRRALYVTASKQMTAGELFAEATMDGGPFEEHLHDHLLWLRQHNDLAEELHTIIRDRTSSDAQSCERLLSVGLVRRVGQTIVPRCRLYADYLGERI